MDAIYIRISDDEEGLALGVKRQLQDSKALAENAGYEVPDSRVFNDNDISASTRSKQRRPEFERLVDLIKAGDVRRVWAYSTSRLTRRPAELETLIKLHESTGVVFHTVQSGAADLSTADGRMIARVLAATDAAEAERIGERVARQKRQRAEMGLPQGGRERLYGYTRKWELVEAEAEEIRDAFTRRAAGESITSIANDMSARGLSTVAFTCKIHSDRWADKVLPEGVAETRQDCDRCRDGNPWKHGTLTRTLRNTTYAGLRSYKGEIVGNMRKGFPVIVDETTFYAAQAVNEEAARPGTNTRRYLLSGFTRCGDCGGKMKGSGNASRAPRYRCAKTYGGCGTSGVQQSGVRRT